MTGTPPVHPGATLGLPLAVIGSSKAPVLLLDGEFIVIANCCVRPDTDSGSSARWSKQAWSTLRTAGITILTVAGDRLGRYCERKLDLDQAGKPISMLS